MARMLTTIKESLGRMIPGTGAATRARMEELENNNWLLKESITQLQLDIENEGYMRLAQSAVNQPMNRQRLVEITKLATQMAIKNPITCRSVNVQADYVFGQGVRFIAKHPLVQSVVDEWANYPENQKVLTSHTAMLQREKDQQVEGNLFFILYTNKDTGRVIVRVMHVDDVDDIIRDPNDYEKELFIKRTVEGDNGSTEAHYYPALGVTREAYPLPPPAYDPKGHHKNGPVFWNAPVLHIGVNRFGKWKFGIPEVYPQLDWALAYKGTLENFVSIIKAYARMAFKVSGLSGKKQVAAAKNMLGTKVTTSSPNETNPSPAQGAFGLFGRGVDLEAVKTAGATTPPGEFAPVLNMAASSVGLPNTFYGDASIGNYATAKTLDRPTELKMLSRQKLWQYIFSAIIRYVVEQSAECPTGILGVAGAGFEQKTDLFTGTLTNVLTMPGNSDSQYGPTDEPIDPTVAISFPEILERNVTDRVRALVNAATLFGKQLTDIIPDKRMVALLLLQALNVENAERLIPAFVAMWEKNLGAKDGKPVDAITVPPPAPPPPPGAAFGKGKKGAEDPSQGGDVGANG